MGYIDTDTHVLETDETWDYLDPSERHFRPTTAQFVDTSEHDKWRDRGLGRSDELWVIGGAVCRRHAADGRSIGFGKQYEPGVTGVTDTAARLKEMDLLGIDVQLLISSIFLGITVDNPLREAALCRSYNRWLAERTADSGGRLPWLIVPPTGGDIGRAIEELEFGREHGATGVMLKGIEHGMYLDDPYFYPMYEKAQDLGLAMSIHMGADTQMLRGRQVDRLIPTPAAIIEHLGWTMKGFHAVLSSDFDTRFPNLRWAFLESGCTWVPAVFQQHQRLISTGSATGFIFSDDGKVDVQINRIDVAEVMARKKMYVACENDEDLPYLTKVIGENQIVFGSDYCHNDIGSDPMGHSTLLARSDLAEGVARKIVDANGRALFGILADFTPSDQAKHAALVDKVEASTSA